MLRPSSLLEFRDGEQWGEREDDKDTQPQREHLQFCQSTRTSSSPSICNHAPFNQNLLPAGLQGPELPLGKDRSRTRQPSSAAHKLCDLWQGYLSALPPSSSLTPGPLHAQHPQSQMLLPLVIWLSPTPRPSGRVRGPEHHVASRVMPQSQQHTAWLPPPHILRF